MKKIKFILLACLLIPTFIFADSYEQAVEIANSYLLNTTYKNTYSRYLIEETSEFYKDSDEKFSLGGLLSHNEFLITVPQSNSIYYSELSYLYDGIEYWTYTKDNGDIYVVSNDVKKKVSKTNISPKTRVTEYVKSKTMVEGSGTRKDPWIFSPIYMITLKSNEYGKIYLKKGEKCDGGELSSELNITYNNKNEKINVCLIADSGYKYISNTCSMFTSIIDDTLTINNVIKDLNCTIYFGKETYEVKLSQTNAESKSVPESIYLVYKQGWYKDIRGITQILKLDKIPLRKGYTFNGYQAKDKYGNDVKVIDSDGNVITKGTLELFNNKGNLDLIWTANKYRVTLNSGSGVTTTGTTNVEATYDSAMNKITVPTKGGYIFNGYYTGTNGSGTKYYNADGTSARIWDITNNTTLYAYWTICPAGSYALAGATSCTSCPEGYTSDAGSSSSSKCLKYTCSSGTLTKDNSKGYVCVVNGSASTYSYQCNCYTYGYACGCRTYCAYTGQSCSPRCACSNPSFCGCGYSCYSYCAGWGTSCSTCYAQSCSTCYAANYYCPSGWSTYSGSGSSLKCYKNALINN